MNGLTELHIFDSFVLGVVQGITEFLPVSSTAHVSAATKLLDLYSFGKTFDVILNLGTFLAIIAYFYKDCLRLFLGGLDFVCFKKSDNKQFFLTIFLANIPTIIIFGIAELLKFEISSLIVTGINLVIFGGVLYFCDQRASDKTNVSRSDAFIVGIAQLLSLIPGVSRLGACLSVCLYKGYSRWESFKFSMLFSLVPVAGACFLKLIKFVQNSTYNNIDVLVGIFSSFVFGTCTLHFMSYFLKKYTFTSIVVYRILFGICVLLFSVFGLK